MSEVPANPIVQKGNIEYTSNQVNDVFSMVSAFLWGLAETENHSILNDQNHL
jgi:hypothetical protein